MKCDKETSVFGVKVSRKVACGVNGEPSVVMKMPCVMMGVMLIKAQGVAVPVI